jgi:hypothetical protein|tara:strand:- start:247 stop:639 length:393 start_codon:yes stop_codon:yes gene_type:complete
MSIVTNTSRMTKSNPTTKFSIRLNEDETVEFRPTGTFAHVTTEQVLKIVTKADVDVTAENNKNKVNFKLTGKDKLFGFLNYFDNDLSDESVSTEVKAVLKDVKSALSTVELGDITLPMTAGQADDLIDDL